MGKQQRTIRYRFTESGADWVIYDDGHYGVLRCGYLAPDVAVRLKVRRHRRGCVQALLPGWGPSPRPVIVVVALEAPQVRQYDEKRPPGPVMRYYRPEDLEVIP